MGNMLKSLFQTKAANDTVDSQSSAQDAVSINNPRSRQAGESYKNYGKRCCGLANGNPVSLPPFLQSIYNSEKNQQAQDAAQQQKLKIQTQDEINNLDTRIKQEENNVELQKKKIDEVKERITELTQKIAGLRHSNSEVNKSANTKMILGIVILIPLTVYLFMFYSSTFYSAFFKDFETAANTGIKAAMFDPQALGNALSEGVTELLFVLCAPIIFLGLGYTLHIFTQQKSNSKYLKMVAIVLVTLLFDCILAYLIGKSIYDFNRLNSLEDLPEYSIPLAIQDINTWAVIFCGFVVYIIWGIVFDMAYTGFEDRTSNKREIDACEIKINSEKAKEAQLDQELNDLKNKLLGLNGERDNKQRALNNNLFIDLSPIKVAFSDFFSGWMEVMPALGASTSRQEGAKSEYNQTYDNFFTNTIQNNENK